MKLGSLFSGGGLGDFGFMLAGIDCAWHCEFDPEPDKVIKTPWQKQYNQKILSIRYPESTKYGDIHTINPKELERVEIITGGIPCQPFSFAGKRHGKSDNRYLWSPMFEIIKVVRPSWVVVENVPGIINVALDNICADLEKEGYEVGEPIVFPSHALGAHHKRDRVWILANATDARVKGMCERQESTIEDVCHTSAVGLQGKRPQGKQKSYAHDTTRISMCPSDRWREYWSTEPAVGRRLNGYPDWLDFHIGKEMSYATQIRYNKKLRELWNPVTSKALWETVGRFNRIQKAEILFEIMCEHEKDSNKTRILLESKEALKAFVRSLWLQEKITGSSSRSDNKEQRGIEYTDSLQTLSRLLAHNLQEDWTISSWEDGIPRVDTGVKDRINRLKVLGNAQVPACTYVIGKMIMEIEKGSK